MDTIFSVGPRNERVDTIFSKPSRFENTWLRANDHWKAKCYFDPITCFVCRNVFRMWNMLSIVLLNPFLYCLSQEE